MVATICGPGLSANPELVAYLLVKRQRAGRLLASRDGGGWNEQTWQQSIPKDEAAQDNTRSS
jgi:hypothetical protein